MPEDRPFVRPDFTRSKAFSERAARLIPGSSHTYSRGPDRFPLESPNGITHGKGARVWDADGNEFVDWSMALTAASLGYADPGVNAAVHTVIDRGILFQRTSEIELEAAELFVETVGTDMVKFARHGSSVTTAAVKLARAFTGRNRIAIPQEHPFFSFDDWFIGVTESDFGVPQELKQFTVKFSYNDIESVRRLFREHPGEIACVMLEPVKFDPPADGFLEELRELCTRNGTVLAFDEMVSGFKYAVPGAARMLGIEADLYTFGKGIANGFAMAALAGRREIMELGGTEREGERKLFLLSTTHGGEAVGLAAMMETIRRLADGRIIAANGRTGETLRTRLHEVIASHGLANNIKIIGYPHLMATVVKGPEGRIDNAFTTLFMQEVIAAGVLFQGMFYPTPSHGPAECDLTVAAFDHACGIYKRALQAGEVGDLLVGPPMKPVFRRFN